MIRNRVNGECNLSTIVDSTRGEMSWVLNLEFCDHLAGTTWKSSWFDALSEALPKLVTTCRQIEEGTYELRGRSFEVQPAISGNTRCFVGLVYIPSY